MKFIKILMGMVALLGIVFVIGGVMLPKDFAVERSIVVQAPVAIAYAEVADLKGWEEWSPWKARDPNMTITYGARTRGVGASYSWESESEGSGSLEVVEADAPNKIKTKLDFGEMGTSTGHWSFAQEGGNTRITWGLKGTMPGLVGGWLGLKMDDWVGRDFEEGLAMLKPIIEEKARKLQTVGGAMEAAMEEAVRAAGELGGAMGEALEAAAKAMQESGQKLDEATREK